MDCGEGIYTRMAGYAGLSALVGVNIEPGGRRQGASLPAVTYRRITTPQFHTMGTDSSDGVQWYEVTSWGVTQDAAEDVAAQVSAALKDYSGTQGEGDDTITFSRIFIEDDRDAPVMDVPGEQPAELVFGVQQDFKCCYD